jgi:hypothetical protein
MAYATATNQVQSLKELYKNDSPFMKNLVYSKNPLLSLIPKDESPTGLAGKYLPVPIVYSTGQGRATDIATAQTNQSPTVEISFFVYRVSNYAVATITNELLEATASDMGAFMKAGTLQMNGAVRTITNDLAHDLFSDGSGSRGVISAISTGVITLATPSDVVNFEVNQVLTSYSVAGLTATVSTGGNLGYVIAVNRTSGTVTVSATSGGAAGTPTNWSTSFPNLAVQGDINFAASGLAIGATGAKKVCGLAGWLPKTAPTTGDSFWGVDRSTDASRLAGVRYDGSAQPIEEALIDGAALVAREGGQPDMAFVSFASFAALEKALGAKVQYAEAVHDESQIAFKGITVNAPYGTITVMPDRSCTSKTAYLLQMETWKLRTLNKAPHVLTYGEFEGLQGLRIGNSDAVEIRVGYYGNLTCEAPGWNCVISLAQ